MRLLISGVPVAMSLRDIPIGTQHQNTPKEIFGEVFGKRFSRKTFHPIFLGKILDDSGKLPKYAILTRIESRNRCSLVTFGKEALEITHFDRSQLIIFAVIVLLASSGLVMPLSSYGTTPSSAVSGVNFQKVVIIEPSSAMSSSHDNSPGIVQRSGPPPTLLTSVSDESSKVTSLPPDSYLSVYTEGSVTVITASSLELLSSQQYFSTNGEIATSTTLQSYYSTNPSYLTAAIPGLWLDSNRKRRSRSQIYVEILELLRRGPMTPFEIAFYARLNHKRTKEYTEFLKLCDYLQTAEEEGGHKVYVLTKEGTAFLERAKALFQYRETSTAKITSLNRESFG